MPSTAVRPARSRNSGLRGKHAGSSRQGVDPRQKTLTQIDFVTRLFSPSSEQDLEYEDGLDLEPIAQVNQDYDQQETRRPRKRRRHDLRASLSPQPTGIEGGLGRSVIQSKSHSSPGPANDSLGLSHPEPPSQLPPPPPPTRSSTTKPAAQVLADTTLMPPPSLPKTPSRQRRTYVPSSQSPELTPLTIRSSEIVPKPQRSPLHLRSSNSAIRRSHRGPNGVEKKPNPFGRYAVIDSRGREGIEVDDSGDGSGNEMDQPVSKLQLGHLQTPRAVSRSGRLEHSPDVRRPKPREVLYVEDSSQVEPELPAQPQPTRQTSQNNSDPDRDSQLSVSRILTAIDADSNSAHTLAKRSMATQIPSSQATTQLPTQYYDRTQGHSIAEPETGPEHDTEPDLPPVRGVTSSQATTVVPSSSNSASNITPQPRRSKDIEARNHPRHAEEKNKIVPYGMPGMLSTSQALDGWEWDGKDWTDSQLLPPALMNFPLPGLPPATQDGIGDLDEAVLEEVDDIEARAKQSKVAEHSDDAISAKQSHSRRNNATSGYGTTRIKSEPGVADSIATPLSKNSEKRAYSSQQRGSRKRAKDEPNE